MHIELYLILRILQGAWEVSMCVRTPLPTCWTTTKLYTLVDNIVATFRANIIFSKSKFSRFCGLVSNCGGNIIHLKFNRDILQLEAHP